MSAIVRITKVFETTGPEAPVTTGTCEVYLRGTTTPATLYTDATGGTVTSNPATITNGVLSTFVTEGSYDLVPTISGTTYPAVPFEAVSGNDIVANKTAITTETSRAEAAEANLQNTIGNPAITLSGTPSTGYVPTATSPSAATWQASSGGGGGSSPPASPTVEGIVQLTNDLGGTATAPTTPTAVHLAGAETITGVKAFSASPTVPTPSTSTQVAPKSYVDGAVGKVGTTPAISVSGTPSAGQALIATSSSAANWAASSATSIGAPAIAVTGTPSVGYVPTATSSSAATWQAASGGGGSGTIGSPPVTVSGTPSAGEVLVAVNSSNAAWGTDVADIPQGVIWLQDPTLTGGPADNTGTSYCDAQFNAAVARAQAIINAGPAGITAPMISGLPGVYKLGQYGCSIGVGADITFGGFGGGADQCARFYFPGETGYPTCIGMIENYTGSSTTLVVTHLKNNFAPASTSHPQPFITTGNHLYWYTGVTGSAPTQTLTLQSPLGTSSFSGTEYDIVANAAFVCAGRKDGYTFDKSICLLGPSTGSIGLWHPASTLNSSTTLPASTIPLVSTSGFPTSGEVMIAGPNFKAAVTYTNISGANLTGCSVRGGGTYAFPSGADVIYITPPNAMDGVSVGNRGGIDCFCYGWRNVVVMYRDHERIGPNFYPLASDNAICLESWPDVNAASNDTSGNQIIEGVSDMQGMYWSAIYVTACNQFIKLTLNGGHTIGNQPWAFWKESTLGKTGAVAGLMSGTVINNVAFEGQGLGLMGDPDSNSAAYFYMVGCQNYNDGTAAPGSAKYIAEFAINIGFTMVGAGDMMNGPNPHTPGAPYFFGDFMTGTMDCSIEAVKRLILNRTMIGMVPRLGGETPNWRINFPGGLFTHIIGSASTGSLVTAGGQLGSSGMSYITPDDGTGALAGIVVSPVSGQSGANVGIIANSQLWGPVNVNCNSSGDITSGSWVRGNGAAHSATAKSATGLGDTTAQIFARAVGADGGTGSAPVVFITPGV